MRLLCSKYSNRTGFEIDPPTWSAVCRNASLLARVSPERIRDEFDKIITDRSRRRGLELLVTGGLTALVSMISEVAVIIVLGLMGLAGMFSAMGLKEVTED